jgi:hypothetical protein
MNFNGVPEVVIPDNLKSGITKACLNEPDIDLTYNNLHLTILSDRCLIQVPG